MSRGILSYGAYVPMRRLQRKAIVAANSWFNSALRSQGKGERAMANWDEDSVTMAVAAARDLKPPVKLEITRKMMFETVGHRTNTQCQNGGKQAANPSTGACFQDREAPDRS